MNNRILFGIVSPVGFIFAALVLPTPNLRAAHISVAETSPVAFPAPSPLSLWYMHPAKVWTEALPLGNGRIGAMMHGGVGQEHLQINEDTLTSGEPPADLDLHPAKVWTEALPLGNGRIGAMMHGGVGQEHLQINEDTLTSGEPPADLRTIDITKDFAVVTNLIRSGRNAEADAFVTKHWLGRNQQCYQPLGDLFLDFGTESGITDFCWWRDQI